MIRRFFLSFLIGLAVVAGSFGLSASIPSASAQVTSGLQQVGATISLPSTDPRIIISRIINVALGLIGIILVVLILYAGFLYMTSGGEAEKTAKAKKIITGAVIGLVIILSAWAITRFVIDRLLQATSEGGGGVSVSGGGGGLGGGFAGGGGAEAFRAKSITPAGSVTLRNIQVKIVFNKAVDPAGSSAIAIMKKGGATVGGTVDMSGSVATFTPAADCPAPNADRKCFDADTDFVVKIGGSLRSMSGQTITCSGFGSTCDGAFHSGTIVDTKPPTVKLTYPTDGMPVKANSVQRILADASDDAGIATVEFLDGTASITVDAPTTSSTPLSFEAKADWFTTGAALGAHSLFATAKDVDTNTSDRSGVSVVVRAEHCFNGKLDAPNETGIDCGGDPSSAEFCGSCPGGSCTKNSDCSSGFCSAGKCVVQPVISSLSPADGKAGTFVTIKGTNFGYTNGTVTFLGAAGTGDDKVATAPAVCVTAGVSTWTNTQAIVEVPAGAASGPIEVKNTDSGLADATNDTNGPSVPNFVVNGKEYPGLCSLSPASAIVGAYVDAIGQGFGTAGKVLFKTEAKTAEASIDSWSDGKVRLRVPIVNTGTQGVSVQSATGESNAVDFEVLEKTLSAPPSLVLLDPAEGPPQQYLTLSGNNFGYSLGKVVFTATDGSGAEAIGDTSFPTSCGDGFWRDDRVVVKAPLVFTSKGSFTDGKYKVKIVRSDSAASNDLEFNANSSLKLTPGICAIQPSVGPKGTAVKIFGDRFGSEKPFAAFYLGKSAVVDSNTNQEVVTKVPDGAITGPVTLKVSDVLSNKVNFQVRNCNESPDICASGKEQCCPTGECRPSTESCGVKALSTVYAWQTSTGLIPVAPRVIEECDTSSTSTSRLTPSPSPWSSRAGGDSAATDSSVFLRFSRILQKESLRGSSFRFQKCTGKSTDPCATGEKVEFDVSAGTESTDQSIVELVPRSKFATSTTYEVKVLSSVKATGEDGAQMEVVKSCGTGVGGETYGYCFRFKTRATNDPSKVGSVLVAPSTYLMSDSGEKTAYKSLPTDAADQCVILNCRRFDWEWYTASKTSKDSDTRAIIKSSSGSGLCENDVTGVSETGEVPVNINAEIAKTGPAGLGMLFIKFLPPHVVSYFPNCQQACSNVYVWAEFSGELNDASVKKADTSGNLANVEIRPCKSENCIEAELGTPLELGPTSVHLDPPAGSDDPGRKLLISQKDKTGKDQLRSGMFYRVLLKGGPSVSGGITGKNGVPMNGRNHPLGFQWKFRVKPDVDATCKADRIDVLPHVKYETVVGARQAFSATAYGKPDECSADGQTIDPSTPADWNSEDVAVAVIYRTGTGPVDTGAPLPAGCSGKCLATGAAGQYGKVAVCGNGIVETTDPSWCKALGLGTDACRLMPAGAAAGEECEPKIHGGACDPSSCLFYPVKSVASGGTCGNGVVDLAKGEACDFGVRCTGAAKVSGIEDGTPCADDKSKAACTVGGGTCGVIDWRGCSASCRHLGASAGKSTCGISDPAGDGKDCDDGNTTDGDGCSASCLHEGSKSGDVVASVCGNGKLEPGEVCEASISGGGIPVFPAGCDTKACLHTGKLACSSSGDKDCCGNGKIESGEDCDGGDGCSASCLFKGSSTSYSSPSGAIDPSFCGNGILERGEQCESGAPSSKVAETIGYLGSSPSVEAALKAFSTAIPSGPQFGDPSQLAYIVGDALPDPTSGVIATSIDAAMEGQIGKAIYGVQCGLKNEKDCKDPEKGLDANGCCRERPKLALKYPAPDSKDVCRNVLVQGGFNAFMDQGSVFGNIEISEATTTSKCATGTHDVVAFDPYAPGFFGWIHRAWDSFVAFVTGRPAVAVERWCTGSITGQLAPVGTTSTKLFAFQLDHALAKNTKYRVRFIGDNSTSTDPLSDNADPAKRIGVKTVRGVVRANTNDDSGPLAWTFTTGDKICSVNVITITDTTPDPKLPERPHPFLFTNPTDKGDAKLRSFSAKPESIQGGIAVSLSSTSEYGWTWQKWSSSDVEIVKHPIAPSTKPTEAVAEPMPQNGNAILSAGIEISADSVSVPPTTSSTVNGIAPVSVLACENPWPSIETSPLRDMFGSPNFKTGDPFAPGPFFNFSTMYCRDAENATSTSELLPALNVNQVMPTILDVGQGILRQYLFSYPDEKSIPGKYQGLGLKQDGIGVRIVANPQHLSPEEWYLSRGFTGSPTAMLVDGYPAVKDGTTVYVTATNRPVKGGKIYSNVYLISYNQDAKPVTVGIFEQMVKYLSFNINKEFTDQRNVCVTSAEKTFTDPSVNGGFPVSCVADWECLRYARLDASLHCDSTKWKLVRDSLRLLDFQFMARLLESKKDSLGKYPQLTSGTFLQGQTYSLWTSWKDQLGSITGLGLPLDPVNRFETCGQCLESKDPCQDDTDCQAIEGKSNTCGGGSYDSKGAWKFNADIDPKSCWNQKGHSFICPAIPAAGDYGVSRLYAYRSFSEGIRYDLGSEFEVPPITGKLDQWWSPPLAQGTYRCAATSIPGVSGMYCANSSGTGGDDKLCRPCPNGICTTCQTGTDAGKFCAKSSDCAGTGIECKDDGKIPTVTGSCRQVGGSFTFRDICNNTAIGDAGRCGDGVVNTKVGTDGKPVEICETGMTKFAECKTTAGDLGHKKQICDMKDCKSYIDDPLLPQCVADTKCGNGRVDTACVGGSTPGKACTKDGECGGGICKAETCDDGSLNGKYGHCNATCDGFGGFCGDKLISPGEVCDNGPAKGDGTGNGDYGSTCSTDCRGVGPKCGDLTLDGPEECDGGTDTTTLGICTLGSGSVVGKKTCTTATEEADCGVKGGCAVSPSIFASCEGVIYTDPATKIVYPTQHTRSCGAPGAKDPATGSSVECKYSLWSSCLPKGSCGDGIKDPGEGCDSGSANSDTGACTKQCKRNVCGDGKPYVGIEECDNGADNGKVTCSSDYGSSCLSCSKDCKWSATAGGYCGDAVKNGPEQCDAADGLSGVTCETLGYDYGTVPVKSAPSGTKGTCQYYDLYLDCIGKTGCADLKTIVDAHESCTETSNCEKKSNVSHIDLLAFGKGMIVTYKDGVTDGYAAEGACIANVVSCASSCTYGGCARCADTSDTVASKTGVIGYVLDAVYSKPVPKARVTVMYKGVKIAETYTDDKGKFNVQKLNTNMACNSYKLVIDYYGDNPNTTEYDESIAGGYWPFTSDPFLPRDFNKVIKNDDGIIFLLPRVRKSETLVFVNWKGSLGGTGDIDAHLLLPYAMTVKSLPGGDPKFPDTRFAYSPCSGKDCVRDIKYNAPGLKELTKFPYGRMYCYKVDEEGELCEHFNKAPEVMKYSRRFVSSGTFGFYLVDYFLAWASAGNNYTDPLGLSVSVVTDDAVTGFAPPKRTSEEICKKTSPYEAVWNVFDQDAATGEITGRNEFITKAEADKRQLSSLGPSDAGYFPVDCGFGSGGGVTLPTSPPPLISTTSGVAICASGTACCEKDPAHEYRAGLPGCFDSACTGTGVVKTCKAYCTSSITTDCCVKSAGRDACIAGLSSAPAPSIVPVLYSIDPATKKAGSPKFSLIAFGEKFTPSSAIVWNGTRLPTTFSISGIVFAEIPAEYVSSAGTAGVFVETAGPGGGSSAVKVFTITP